MGSRTQIVLVVILLVAAAARIAFSVGVVGWSSPMKSDETDYHAIATNLSSGNGFVLHDGVVTARRPPAYPLLLSLLYRVTGPSPAAGRALQVVLGVVLVWLVFLLGQRYFDSQVGLVAAGFAAINPFLVFISGYILTENAYVAAILLFLIVTPTPRALHEASLRRFVIAALLLGLAALFRPTAMILTATIACVCILWGTNMWQKRFRRVALFALVVGVTVLPWMVRNSIVLDGWAGLTTHGGITFFQGNNPKILSVPHYRGGVAPLESLPRYNELARMSERERDRLAWQMGRQYLRHNWRDAPRLMWWKFLRFWRLKSDAGLSGIRSGWWFNKNSRLGSLAARVDVGLAYAVIVLPLFVVGLFLSRCRYRELAFLYCVIAAHTGAALVFFGSLRSRIPVEPVIAVFGAMALAVLMTRLVRRTRQGQAET